MSTWASLADGQLSNSKATLFTATGQTAVTGVIVSNADASSSHTINIYIKRSGSTSRLVSPLAFPMAVGSQPQNLCDDSETWRLSTGDVIEGFADTAAKVDYIIMGVTP